MIEPHEIFNRAWDVLVEHAGALDDEDMRTDFVRAFLDRPQLQEWRFGGKLGSGASSGGTTAGTTSTATPRIA